MKNYKKLIKFIENHRAKEKLIRAIAYDSHFYFFEDKQRMRRLRKIITNFKIKIKKLEN